MLNKDIRNKKMWIGVIGQDIRACEVNKDMVRDREMWIERI